MEQQILCPVCNSNAEVTGYNRIAMRSKIKCKSCSYEGINLLDKNGVITVYVFAFFITLFMGGLASFLIILFLSVDLYHRLRVRKLRNALNSLT